MRIEYQEELAKWKNLLVNNCPICKGASVVQKDSVTQLCECMKQAMNFSKLVCNGLPRKYVNPKWSWDDVKGVSPELLNKLRGYCNNFNVFFDKGLGLYIYGNSRNNITLLETLIAKEISTKENAGTYKNFSVQFIMYEDLLQTSHFSRDDKNARVKLDEISYMFDILIIDNVGNEAGSIGINGYSTKVLDSILSKRNNEGLITCISSSLTPEEIGQRYSPSVENLIKDNCKMIKIVSEEDDYLL